MAAISSFRLQDFSAFAPFAEVARRAETDIVLHGGTAFRAALYAAWQNRLDVDLFDLVPFNSDIDLEHNGSAEKTAQIAALIDTLIPFASWCRWSINDAERADKARAQRDASTDIPLRRIRFSTSEPAYVPTRAQADIDSREVSFERNPRFGRSDAELRPDLEIFGLMVALNSWSEAQEIANGPVGFEEERAMAWILEGFDAEALQRLEKPAIAARFWHLFSLRLARHGLDRFNLALARLGGPILDRFGASIPKIFDVDRAISVSKMTSSANFRVPELTPQIVTGEAAVALFGALIRRAADLAGYPLEDLPDDPLDLIDPSLDLIGIVPDLTLMPYGSGKDGADEVDDPFLSGLNQEFVQFAWEVEGGEKPDPQGLTGQMLALGARDFGTATALPVVGGMFGSARAWVRARLDDLIEPGPDGAAVGALLLILQARPDEAEETERGPKLRQHGVPGEIMRNTEYDYTVATYSTESEHTAIAMVNE
ncbi:hypothetical protein [Flavisphingomonas formosensis]|uniref:hypothetical protein n=1 Tax=Flavisphingomonas formosensis TaxID=861534 RepID=UPI0012F9F1E0|nr:hypothetical protein [Sphingomonas formosensis]